MHEKPDQHEALNHIHTSVFGRLDRDFVNLYNQHAAETPDKPIDLGVLRTKYSQLYAYGTAPAPEPSKVFDSEVPGYAGARLAVRVYQPDIPGPWPVHMNFHGGGWALGDLDTESHICKHYCVKAKVNVIDIAYRLIPEAPFPTGILDSFEALKYVYENGADVFGINSSRISLGAVSAGGNIALILAHLARDSGIPLQLVTAGTPVIDDISTYETPEDSPFPSMTEMEHAPTLNWMRLEWFDNLKWHSYQTILQYGRTSCDKWVGSEML